MIQATRYTSASSIPATRGSVSYAEISVTGIGRSSEGWSLLPLKLLVDLPLARELGEPYGFPKVLAPELRLAGGAWTLRALAGEGRVLSAARGLGGVLLTPLWLALRHARSRLLLPRSAAYVQFEALAGISPALGHASPALRKWAFEMAFLFPLGVLLRRFRFVLEEPLDRPR